MTTAHAAVVARRGDVARPGGLASCSSHFDVGAQTAPLAADVDRHRALRVGTEGIVAEPGRRTCCAVSPRRDTPMCRHFANSSAARTASTRRRRTADHLPCNHRTPPAKARKERDFLDYLSRMHVRRAGHDAAGLPCGAELGEGFVHRAGSEAGEVERDVAKPRRGAQATISRRARRRRGRSSSSSISTRAASLVTRTRSWRKPGRAAPPRSGRCARGARGVICACRRGSATRGRRELRLVPGGQARARDSSRTSALVRPAVDQAAGGRRAPRAARAGRGGGRRVVEVGAEQAPQRSRAGRRAAARGRSSSALQW